MTDVEIDLYASLTEEAGHGPKCFLVGVLNQSLHCVYSLLILEGLITRKKSRVNLRYQRGHIVCVYWVPYLKPLFFLDCKTVKQ